jgi:hypothetical protein
VSQESSFPRQKLDIAAVFPLASSTLSATPLSPNPALERQFFTVCAFIFCIANPIKCTASRTGTELANA